MDETFKLPQLKPSDVMRKAERKKEQGIELAEYCLGILILCGNIRNWYILG